MATQEIDRDVDRTFPSNLAFMSTCREELRRVLSAIAYRVPRIGYCQGMNFIAGLLQPPPSHCLTKREAEAVETEDERHGGDVRAWVCAGMLLLLLEEEDAFWAMLTFVDKLVPAYFVRDLIGNRTDERVLDSLLKVQLPVSSVWTVRALEHLPQVVAEAMQTMGVSVAMLVSDSSAAHDMEQCRALYGAAQCSTVPAAQ